MDGPAESHVGALATTKVGHKPLVPDLLNFAREDPV